MVEEEVVVEKRPVAKEEIRICKEAVEEDVRKEEVEIDDQTAGRGGRPGGAAGRGGTDRGDESRCRGR